MWRLDLLNPHIPYRRSASQAGWRPFESRPLQADDNRRPQPITTDIILPKPIPGFFRFELPRSGRLASSQGFEGENSVLLTRFRTGIGQSGCVQPADFTKS